MFQQQTHVALTPVLAEQADEFEELLAQVVGPAVRAERPELADRWTLLRSTAAEDGVITYVLLFDGGDLDSDWDLGVLLTSHYDEETALQHLETWSRCIAPYRRWVTAQGEPEDERSQLLWTCRTVTEGPLPSVAGASS